MDINQIIDAIHLSKLDHLDEHIASVIDSNDHEGLFELGETLYQFGLTPQSLKVFEQLFHLYPNEPELLAYYIESLLSENDVDKALEVLHHAPDTAEKLMLEADLYQQQGMIEVAMEKLKAAEHLAPEESVIQFALAELLYYDGQYLPAARRYEQLIAAYPVFNGVNLSSRLGDAMLQAGNYEQAVNYFDALDDKEMTSDDYFKKAIAHQKNDHPQEAIDELVTLLDKDPDYMQAYLLLVNLYEAQRMYEEAIDAGQRGLQLNEFFKELLVDTARIMLRMKRSGAEEYLIQSLTIDPSYTEAALLLSDHYKETGQFEEMIQLFTLLDEEDLDPIVKWNIAYSYQQLEKDFEARHFYESAYLDLNENVDFLKEYYEYLLETAQDVSQIESDLIKHDKSFIPYER